MPDFWTYPPLAPVLVRGGKPRRGWLGRPLLGLVVPPCFIWAVWGRRTCLVRCDRHTFNSIAAPGAPHAKTLFHFSSTYQRFLAGRPCARPICARQRRCDDDRAGGCGRWIGGGSGSNDRSASCRQAGGDDHNGAGRQAGIDHDRYHYRQIGGAEEEESGDELEQDEPQGTRQVDRNRHGAIALQEPDTQGISRLYSVGPVAAALILADIRRPISTTTAAPVTKSASAVFSVQ